MSDDEVTMSDKLRVHRDTFHTRELADPGPGGRWLKEGEANVIGSTLRPAYPAAAGPWSDPLAVGVEPPVDMSDACGLTYNIPLGEPHELHADGTSKSSQSSLPLPTTEGTGAPAASSSGVEQPVPPLRRRW